MMFLMVACTLHSWEAKVCADLIRQTFLMICDQHDTCGPYLKQKFYPITANGEVSPPELDWNITTYCKFPTIVYQTIIYVISCFPYQM